MGRRILFLSGDRALARTGAGPFAATLRGLATALVPRAVELCAIVVGERGATPAFELCEGVRVVPVGGRRPGRVRRLRAALAQQGGALERCLVVSHDYGLCLEARAVLPLARRGVLGGWVAEIHHLPGLPFECGPRGALERWSIERWIRRAAPSVTRYRCVEPRYVPQRLRELGVPAERLAVVPAVYLAAPPSRPLPAGERDLDLLWVGRWRAEKGTRLVRPMLEILAASGPLRLKAIGRGVTRGMTRAARGLDGVECEVREVVSEAELERSYRRARVLVCPSLCEGGPRVVAEAIASGTPVVATPVGRVEEWMGDPRLGRVVAPEAESLAVAVRELWSRRIAPDECRAAARIALAGCERDTSLRYYAEFLWKELCGIEGNSP